MDGDECGWSLIILLPSVFEDQSSGDAIEELEAEELGDGSCLVSPQCGDLGR